MPKKMTSPIGQDQLLSLIQMDFGLTYRNLINNCKDRRPPLLYTVNQIIHLTFKEHIKILWPGNATYEVIILRIYRPTFQTNTSSLRPYNFTTKKRKKFSFPPLQDSNLCNYQKSSPTVLPHRKERKFRFLRSRIPIYVITRNQALRAWFQNSRYGG